MVVDDLDVVGVAIPPCEAAPPPVVHPDAVLAGSGPSEQLKAVPGRNGQIGEATGLAEVAGLPLRRDLDVVRQAARPLAAPNPLRLAGPERPDHAVLERRALRPSTSGDCPARGTRLNGGRGAWDPAGPSVRSQLAAESGPAPAADSWLGGPLGPFAAGCCTWTARVPPWPAARPSLRTALAGRVRLFPLRQHSGDGCARFPAASFRERVPATLRRHPGDSPATGWRPTLGSVVVCPAAGRVAGA